MRTLKNRGHRLALRRHAEGQAAGMREGWQDGWRDGACRAIAEAVPLPATAVAKRPLRVLYIPQGFEAIDDGIADGLRQSVAELHVGEPARMAEQAALIRPDLVLVLNGLHVFPPDHLQQADAIRAAGIRTAIWFADDPYVTGDTVHVAPHYDTILTHELSTLDLYRSLGCANVYHLPFAADTARFRPIRPPADYRSDVCFIGQAFWNRVETFDAIARELAGIRVFIAGGLWERLTNYRLLERCIRHGWLPVDESVLHYNGAKIVVNIHRTPEAGSDNNNAFNLPGRSVNPRTFEIAGCGAFQLTDRREDLERYYVPGAEIETFGDPAELIGQIRRYLADDASRNRIAMRGLARTLREHTYPARVDRLLQLIGLG